MPNASVARIRLFLYRHEPRAGERNPVTVTAGLHNQGGVAALSPGRACSVPSDVESGIACDQQRRNYQRADLSPSLCALVLVDTQPPALRGLEKEPALERDHKHRAAGRKERVGGEYGGDVCPVKTGRSEVQEQGEWPVP